MSKYLTYKKVDAEEIITIGDVVMIDPKNGYITRAVKGDKENAPINARMVIGVCIDSNNVAKPNIVIDGGQSPDTERVELSSNSENVDLIYLEGGNSEQNPRELIQVVYSGECLVNVTGYVDLGDRLGISNDPGKAKSIDYTDRHYFIERSIGKVIKYTNTKEQVKILLDIE